MADTLTFTIGDGITSPLVTIKITDDGAGNFTFELTQDTSVGNVVGDLRGLFFDTHLDGAGSLVAAGADVTDQQSGNDSVVDLGNGSNMQGALNSDGLSALKKVAGAEQNGYDFGVEFGTQGVGTDDIQSTTFTLSSSGMQLSDFLGMDFGIRATSVGLVTGTDENGDPIFGAGREGSSKAVGDAPDHPDAPPPANLPPDAVDDDPACGTEHTPVIGNVLTNDTDPDSDTLSVTQVNGTDLVFDGDGWATVILANGSLKIQADGDFEYTYTGANLPVGGHADPVDTFTYTISDGTGLEDHADTATVELCVYADAGSPGYWQQHDGSGPQANDWDIAQNTSFETYFGVTGPYGGQWDTTNPVNGSADLVTDITFREAFDIPQGGPGHNHLAQEAVTAVLNLLDGDTDDGFIAAYVYQRANHASADPDAANDLASLTPTQILDDLKQQVQDAFSGAPDAYTITELTDLLIHTHE